jgi:hypothetical protein
MGQAHGGQALMDMSDNPFNIPSAVLPDVQNREGYMFVSLAGGYNYNY